jgi:glycosyltransferase involved in cell wall biosynthesis
MFEFLEEPVPITSQQWSEDTIPLVSISCITYNHENFIRDAIEGFLMQKTTFPVQILIHDDASTDKTARIVKEYELKYPNLIKPVYQTENQYSKKNGTIGRIQRERAIGKYYAMCEGDDYWIDPLKLQKQVDMLEENSDCSICFHSSVLKNIKTNNERVVHDHGLNNKIFKSSELISGKINMWTASILVRTEIIKSIPAELLILKFGDVRLKLWAASKGSVAYIGGGPMSVYRRGVSGAWSEKEGKNVIWEKERLYNHYEIVRLFKELLPVKYHKALKSYKKRVERNYFLSLRHYYFGIDLVLVSLKNLKYINYNIFLPIILIINKISSNIR